MTDKIWTKEELIQHIKANCDYGSVIVCGALFAKLYGEMPKGLGLSGFQGGAIEQLLTVLPEAE